MFAGLNESLVAGSKEGEVNGLVVEEDVYFLIDSGDGTWCLGKWTGEEWYCGRSSVAKSFEAGFDGASEGKAFLMSCEP